MKGMGEITFHGGIYTKPFVLGPGGTLNKCIAIQRQRSETVQWGFTKSLTEAEEKVKESESQF
jgi:hypothetical protein